MIFKLSGRPCGGDSDRNLRGRKEVGHIGTWGKSMTGRGTAHANSLGSPMPGEERRGADHAGLCGPL